MKCPYCGNEKDKVVDSRTSQEGKAVRRRRECIKCEKRFTTYEYVEESHLLVIKKDARREPFDHKKILSGIMKACEKRPIGMEKIENLTNEIEKELNQAHEREVTSQAIGELVMQKLYDLDEIAYVRFASVYRQFKDINQFMKELKKLLG